jgi:hypothetical protein
MWPYSSPQGRCPSESDLLSNSVGNQRISGCSDTTSDAEMDELGMSKTLGRGSPEIDLIEVSPGPKRMSGWELCMGKESEKECLERHSKCYTGPKVEKTIDWGVCPPDPLGFDHAKSLCPPFLVSSYQVSPGFPRWSYEEPKMGCYPVEGQWYPEMLTTNPKVRYPYIL